MQKPTESVTLWAERIGVIRKKSEAITRKTIPRCSRVGVFFTSPRGPTPLSMILSIHYFESFGSHPRIESEGGCPPPVKRNFFIRAPDSAQNAVCFILISIIGRPARCDERSATPAVQRGRFLFLSPPSKWSEASFLEGIHKCPGDNRSNVATVVCLTRVGPHRYDGVLIYASLCGHERRIQIARHLTAALPARQRFEEKCPQVISSNRSG